MLHCFTVFEIPYGFSFFLVIIFKRVLRKNSSPSILLCSDKVLSCFLVPARARCLRVPNSVYIPIYIHIVHEDYAQYPHIFFFLRDYFSSNSSPEPFFEAQRIHLFVNTPQHVCRVIFFFFQIFIFVFNKMVAHLLLTVLCSCSFHYQTSPFMLSPRLKSKKKKKRSFVSRRRRSEI